MNRKVADSRPDEVTEYFSIHLILLDALGPGVYSASNRNEYQNQKKIMFLGSRTRPVRRADSLTAICEPIVYKCGIRRISQTNKQTNKYHGLLRG
jgi:hypothetical protein